MILHLSLSFFDAEARLLLNRWREDSIRRSAEVVSIFEEVLADPSGSPGACAGTMGEEYWMVLEQVAVAAMDVHRKDVVDVCLREIKRQFELDSFRYQMKRLGISQVVDNPSRTTIYGSRGVADYLETAKVYSGQTNWTFLKFCS